MFAVYYVGSCDYTQVEKSLASETRAGLESGWLVMVTKAVWPDKEALFRVR